MKNNGLLYRIVVLFLLMGFGSVCTSCTLPSTEVTEDAGTDFDTFGLQPDLNYEVPASLPGILVDQLGYLTKGTKVAVFKGEELPGEFQVVNADTGEVVYTGVVEPSSTGDTGQGDFSEVTQAGSFYLTAAIVGRSYSFQIGDAVYDALFEEACKKYYYNRCGMTLTEAYAGEKAHNACHTKQAVLRSDISVSMDVSGGWHEDETGSKSVVGGSMTAAQLLLSYELYGTVFTDDMGIPESGNQKPDILDEVSYEIDWLLRMQDVTSGGVYSGVTIYSRNAQYNNMPEAYIEEITPEATAAFAMIMAKFSYLYQDYDKEYALTCLRAADRAWRYLDTNQQLLLADRQEQTEELSLEQLEFMASTELYRATGYRTYRSFAEQYLTESVDTENEAEFLGCVTYISTKQAVNLELCSTIMKEIMGQAEKLSAASRKSPYLTMGNEAQDNNEELLREMMCLTVVDHIITNHEYETLIENYLHYFLGRNAMAITYADDIGTRNYKSVENTAGIMSQFDSNSHFIFMLSEIICHHRTV